MNKGLFVTGTDTGVGKTVVACALLAGFARRGLKVVGMKPVASGAHKVGNRWVNEDAVTLAEAANVSAPAELVNPYVFAPPIAPHIAAREAGVRIELAVLERCYAALAGMADLVVVEGAGGLMVPLDDEASFADLARLLGLPVVLVVGMRLGCINHALLTAESLAARGLEFAGWVANRIDPTMARFEANLDTLRRHLSAPLLGVLPHCKTTPNAWQMADRLDLSRLRERGESRQIPE